MITAVIVDDEDRARKGLQKMVENYCSGIKVVATADSVKSGMSTIREYKPDLVFLDIDMPDGDGFELLEQLNDVDFEVIFATAYDHFAVKAFRFSALDYLVKPIDLDDLIAAVEKVKSKGGSKDKSEQLGILQAGLNKHKFSKIALPGNDGIIFVPIDEVIRMLSDGNYITIFMENGDKHTVIRKLGEYEELLTDYGFFRVHHSHLINLNKIKKYIRGRGGYIVMNDGVSVDVSIRKKDEFLELLKGL